MYTELDGFKYEVNDEGPIETSKPEEELFQFASDIDGDLHLFPRNLNEPDHQNRWHVWLINKDGNRSEALLNSPMMCVNDRMVTNPYGKSGYQEVAGSWVDSLNAAEIEISIDVGRAIRIQHPRR